MNEGIPLDLDNWKANLCRGLGNRYTPAGTEVLISAVVLVVMCSITNLYRKLLTNHPLQSLLQEMRRMIYQQYNIYYIYTSH